MNSTQQQQQHHITTYYYNNQKLFPFNTIKRVLESGFAKNNLNTYKNFENNCFQIKGKNNTDLFDKKQEFKLGANINQMKIGQFQINERYNLAMQLNKIFDNLGPYLHIKPEPSLNFEIWSQL